MKILEVIRSVDPTGGGPIEGLKQIGSILQQNGHTLEVLSLDSPELAYLRSFPFPIYALGSGGGSYGYTSKLVPWLRANASTYDVVLVDGLWTYHSFGVWRALRGSETPYAVFTHGMLDPWFKRQYPLKHLKKWMYWPWADYRVCRDAKAVLFTCQEERRLARQSFWLYKVNEVVVSYGSPDPPGSTQQQRQFLFERFPKLRDKRLAVFMSRIHPKKGCDLALEAFARTAAQDPDWQLVMAGPDHVGWQSLLEDSAMRLGIADCVTWTGHLQGDLKWDLLRAAEIFLLPSHQENFGVVVAEALACETPVLISDKVNIHREVEAAGAGLITKDDVDSTADGLRHWLTMSQDDREQMSTRARTCFLQHFEIHRAADLLMTALQQVTGTTEVHSALSRVTVHS
jgi:glycosyltransferase involved in cell wall biosynthesis